MSLLTNPTSAPRAASSAKPKPMAPPMPSSSAPPMPAPTRYPDLLPKPVVPVKGTADNTFGVLNPDAVAQTQPASPMQFDPDAVAALRDRRDAIRSQSDTSPATSAPPARGSVINPTWQSYYNQRLLQLGNNPTPKQLESLNAEADAFTPRYADAATVENATPQMMNQSNAATAGALQKQKDMRGRTVPSPALLPQRTSAPPAAAPMFPPNAAAAGMAGAINDANNGITSRGGGITTTTQGGVIQQSAGGTKTVSSPYGATGSAPGAAGYSIDTGKAGPGDANLRAQTAAIKNRQSQGIFSPAPPAVAAAPSLPVSQSPSLPVSPAAPPQIRRTNTKPGVPISSLNAAPAGSTAANVMNSTPSPAPTVAATAPQPTNNAIAVLGQPTVNNLNKGSNFIPSSRPSQPSPTSAPPAVASPTPSILSAAAPPGGWLNLAKNNFNQSMAGEIVDMTTNKVKNVASTVGRTVKSGYAAVGRAAMPIVQPHLNQARTNLAASPLGKAMGAAPPIPLAAVR